MRVIETKVYTFDELNEKAKEKARDWFRASFDSESFMLGSHLANLAKEELDERGIPHGDITVFYSLGHCQGDGACFVGSGTWTHNGTEYEWTVTHNDRYCHAYSAHIELNTIGDVALDADDDVYEAFKAVYVDICTMLEQAGYSEIEYYNSAEYIDECIEANEYTFTEDGKRFG